MDDFRRTSDRLSELGVGLQEQAAALGFAYQTLRLMRLDPAASGHRKPPPPSSWRSRWAKLLRDRAERLNAEAAKIEGAAQ